MAVELLRAPGRTLPVPGWFPLVVERVHPRLRPPTRPGVRLGRVWMRLDLDDYVQRRIFYGCHEVPETRLLRRLLRPGDAVTDVGANVGFYSLLAADLVGREGRVHAFEPVPANRVALEDHAAANDLPQIVVHPAAVGAEPGRLVLGLDHPDPSAGGVSGHYTVGGARERVVAPVVRLDDHLEGRPRQRLVKIDVEGSEPDVIAGLAATLAANPPDAILVELNRGALARRGHGPDAVLAALTGAGYRLRGISPRGRLAPFCSGGRRPLVNVLALRPGVALGAGR